MSKKVPEGWALQKIGDFATEVNIRNKGEKPIPVLSVTKYNGFVLSLDYFKKQVFSRDTSTYKLVHKGQFAYATIHLEEGSLGLLEDIKVGQVSPMYTVFKTNSGIDRTYFYNLLKSDKFMRLYLSLGQGSIDRRASIYFKVLADVDFLYPPLAEQQKIAAILSSVDAVIEKTRAQINKLKDLKTGMMQELLTKGIGHSEFKDSPVGRIPKGWEVKTLGEITLLIKSGLSRRILSQDIGIPLITSGNIQQTRLDAKDLKYWYLDDPQGANTENYILNDGDILMCFINSMNQIGKSCIYYDIGRPAIYTTNLFRIVSKPEYSPEYLQMIFTTDRFQNEIQLISKPAVNQASFNKSDFEQLEVPVPSKNERDLITQAVTALNNKIIYTERKLFTFLDTKKALMQDLLTGKVRVDVGDVAVG